MVPEPSKAVPFPIENPLRPSWHLGGSPKKDCSDASPDPTVYLWPQLPTQRVQVLYEYGTYIDPKVRIQGSPYKAHVYTIRLHGLFGLSFHGSGPHVIGVTGTSTLDGTDFRLCLKTSPSPITVIMGLVRRTTHAWAVDLRVAGSLVWLGCLRFNVKIGPIEQLMSRCRHRNPRNLEYKGKVARCVLRQVEKKLMAKIRRGKGIK